MDGSRLVGLKFFAVFENEVFVVPVEKAGNNGEGFVGPGGEDVGPFNELGAGGDVIDVAFSHSPL